MPCSGRGADAVSESWWDGGGVSQQLEAMLMAHQQPVSCPQRTSVYPDLMQSGLGSTLMLMSAALSDSLIAGSTFLPPKHSQFASHSK